ncbi:hypothetical protein YC2023_114436 [Brassica napus]
MGLYILGPQPQVFHYPDGKPYGQRIILKKSTLKVTLFQRGILWVDLKRIVFGSDRADEKTEKENRKGDKKQILTRIKSKKKNFQHSKSYSQK